MTQATMKADETGESRLLVICIIAGLIVAAAVVWLSRQMSVHQASTAEVASAQNVQIDSLEDLEKLDQATIISLQESAHAAAAEAVGLPPITSTVTERPAYVSPVEWQVLKAVAAQSPQPEAALTRLVFKLRFSKQWELWQSTDAGARRDALARQLLADIPEQVASNDLARGDAQRLQGEILTQLYPDAQQRQQRMAEEAERIDVRFEIY